MRYVIGWGFVLMGLLLVGLLCSVSLEGERINPAWPQADYDIDKEKKRVIAS